MSANPHFEKANACYGAISSSAASEFNEQLRADALIQATLAVAWETGRLADEQRTANLIASVQPVQLSQGMTYSHTLDGHKTVREEITSRLYPEEAAQ